MKTLSWSICQDLVVFYRATTNTWMTWPAPFYGTNKSPRWHKTFTIRKRSTVNVRNNWECFCGLVKRNYPDDKLAKWWIMTSVPKQIMALTQSVSKSGRKKNPKKQHRARVQHRAQFDKISLKLYAIATHHSIPGNNYTLSTSLIRNILFATVKWLIKP